MCLSKIIKKYWLKITSNRHKIKSGLLIVVLFITDVQLNRKKSFKTFIKYINFKFWMERQIKYSGGDM